MRCGGGVMPDWRSVAQPRGGERSTAPVCRSSSFTGFSAVFRGKGCKLQNDPSLSFLRKPYSRLQGGRVRVARKVTQTANMWDSKMGPRTHIVIPESLGRENRSSLVGKGGRNEFLTQAAEKELRRL